MTSSYTSLKCEKFDKRKIAYMNLLLFPSSTDSVHFGNLVYDDQFYEINRFKVVQAVEFLPILKKS